MKDDIQELTKIKEIFDDTILDGQHFSEEQKRKIRQKIHDRHYFKKSSPLMNKLLLYPLSLALILVSGVFTFHLVSSNNENDSEPYYTASEDKNNEYNNGEPNLSSNPEGNEIIEDVKTSDEEEVSQPGPKTLASLSIGNSVKGTGDLVTEVVSIREIPSSEIQSTFENGVVIGVTVRLENRGKKDLLISPDKYMILKNGDNESQKRIKVDSELDGTIKVGQNVVGEIIFDSKKSKLYKFYFVDLGEEEQTLWKFDRESLK